MSAIYAKLLGAKICESAIRGPGVIIKQGLLRYFTQLSSGMRLMIMRSVMTHCTRKMSLRLGVIHKLCNRLRGEGGLLNCSCLSTWGEGGFEVCLHSLFLSLFGGRGSGF